MPRRAGLLLLITVIFGAALGGVYAQSGDLPAFGDPPVAARITVSPPDVDGIVTITGAQGAVFPNARLTIRNLYTQDTVYADAGVTGSFNAQLYGPGNTPFWISPNLGTVPTELRDVPGSLPGGPGTIIYGAFPEARDQVDSVTQITVDGELTDWGAYQDGALLPGRVYALQNRDSLYLAVAHAEPVAQTMIVLTVDGVTYALTWSRENEAVVSVQRVQPDARNQGTIPVAGAGTDTTVELRFDPLALRPTAATVRVDRVAVLDAEGVELGSISVSTVVTRVDEVDGIVHLNSQLSDAFIRYDVAGPVGGGSGVWLARGRIDRLQANPGETIPMEMDVRLTVPQAPAGLTDVRMVGRVMLQPVTTAQGMFGTTFTNNGWSALQTPSGLAVDNVGAPVPLGEAVAPEQEVLRRGDSFLFGFDFTLRVPEALAPGLYTLIFEGYADLDGVLVPWDEPSALGQDDDVSETTLTRLPLVMNIGAVQEGRLPWVLFHETPSAGSRGVVAAEDRPGFALSNRVRFNSPTYILPRLDPLTGQPVAYSLEPYLLNVMPNRYDMVSAPLVPFLFPSGGLGVTITKPDGTVERLGSARFVQNQLSTLAVDERLRFGRQSPVDVYQLTTLDPRFTDYVFDQDGEYQIQLLGALEDVWGNRYTGGGVYRVLIAESLNLVPGVLPGTPFEVGDVVNPALHLAPAVAADVTVTLRLYPLDGGEVIEQTMTGTANRYGYFYPGSDHGLPLDQPGEYTLDYEARYTDSAGRLWAGSLRSAGVIATENSSLIAHGERGVASLEPEVEPAWFNLRRYAVIIGIDPGDLLINFPYHPGDVAWIADGPDGGLYPVVRLQDTTGAYETWLNDAAPSGYDIPLRAVEDELPAVILPQAGTPDLPLLSADEIANDAYVYVSAVRPGVTLRQFVTGGDNDLPLQLDPDDVYNGQVGAGLNGELPGDYMFLFGGAVVRNSAAGVRETAAYASLAVVTNTITDPLGPRVYPPYRGQAGGADGGPLFTIDNKPVEIFFHPTATRPGDILTVGDTLSVAGQVGPTLPSFVSVQITSPSGEVTAFDGSASATGYFYDPSHNLRVTEQGVYTVSLTVRHNGLTSAGVTQPPLPTGTVPGVTETSFSVYVVPADNEPLPWAQQDFIFTPALQYNFPFTVPQGWTNVAVYRTVTMPGFVVEDGNLPVTGSSFTYQYDPRIIARRFPNWENEGRFDGVDVSDPLRVSLMITGQDADGNFVTRARVFNLLHDRVLSLE